MKHILKTLPLFAFSTPVFAQNTGGIFPPMVDEGHASVQYRITYSPAANGAAQRVHYQQSINDDFMWRVLAQATSLEESPFDFQHAQAELFWDMSEKDDRWKTGLRFDARIRASGDSGMGGLHWTNQFKVVENWNARFVVLTAYDIGAEASGKIGFQTRGNVFTRLSMGPTVGVEFYNSFGAITDIKPMAEQKHQIGPYAFIPIQKHWNLFVGTLHGLTDATDSLELRTWLTWTR